MTLKMPAFVPTPDYVHDLLDTLIGHTKLDFRDHPVPEEVHNRLLHKTGRPAPVLNPRVQLTMREQHVLDGMALGRSNKQIGDELFISEDTVKTHARRLFRKLEARDRAHAVAIAFRAGILK